MLTPCPGDVSPSTNGRRRRALQRQAASLLLVGAIVASAVVFHGRFLSAALAEVGTLPPLVALLLLAGSATHRTLQALLIGNSAPGMTMRRSFVVSEAYAGCSNAMIGGAAVGTGVKVAMLRCWGRSPAEVAASLAATAVAPALAMWSLALSHTAPRVLLGTADRFQTTVAAAAVVGVVGHLGFWWYVLARPGPATRVGRIVDRLLPALGRACRGPLRRLRPVLERVHGTDATCAVREVGLRLVRKRGAALVATGLASQLLLAVLLLLALRGVGENGPGNLEVLRAFAIARVAASFVPTPGGMGVLDVGLFTALVSAGAQAPTAVAALVLFRAATFAVPIVTGTVAVLWWRRIGRHRAPARLASVTALPPAGDRAVPELGVAVVPHRLPA